MTDYLDGLMRAAQSVDDAELDNPATREAVTDLGATVLRSRPRTRRWRKLTAGAAVVLVAAVGGPAIADQVGIGLHTGDFGTLRSGNTSEYWRMDSAEAPALLRSFEKEYPVAPGYSVEPLIKSFAAQHNAQDQEAGWRSAVLLHSFCTWEDSWLRATPDDEPVARAATVRALGERVAQFGRLGQPPQTVDALAGLVEAAARGDRAAVRRDLQLNCPQPMR